MLNDNLNDDDDDDDDDICRALFVRTNMLISRFRHCSEPVKLVLFRSFLSVCMMWHSGIWLLLFVNSGLPITSALKSCLVMQYVIVCLVF